MGHIWLHDWPFYLEKWGVEFNAHPGWELRSRRSGGLEAVRGVGIHHGAGSLSAKIENELNWMYNSSPDRPIGNGLLHRGTGKFTIGAAGATNTQGKGGPVFGSKGVIPLNQGNLYMVSIEAQNTGLGEPWSREMMNGYFKVCMSLCEMFKLNPETDIWTHAAYCLPTQPGRKIDPAGPTPSHPSIGGTKDNNTWNNQEFNKQVALLLPPAVIPPVKRKRKKRMDGIIYPAQEWLGKDKTPHIVVSGNSLMRATNSSYAIAAHHKLPVVPEVSKEHYMYLYNRMMASEVAANK